MNRCSQGCPAAKPFATLGRGSNVIHWCRHSRGSGYSAAEVFETAELVVDLTAVPWDEAVTLSLCGPMVAPFQPAGTVKKVFANLEDWNDTPRPSYVREDKGETVTPDPRFGDVGPLDEVSLDVYLRIVARFGAPIYGPGYRDPAEYVAEWERAS